MSTILSIFPLGAASSTRSRNPRTMRECVTRINFGDGYNQTRDGGTRPHHGIDIMAPMGTPVVSATDGRVITSTKLSGPRGKTGHGITVKTADNHTIHYAHFRDAPLVAVGERVRAGQQIGVVGNTGNAQSSCPHLHIHVEDSNGQRVNPYLELVSLKNGGRIMQGTQIYTNNEYIIAKTQIQNWLIAFGVPDRYWRGSTERSRAATQIRESATREVRAALAEAETKWNSDAKLGATNILKSLLLYTNEMNNYVLRLGRTPQPTPLQSVIRRVSEYTAALIEAVEQAALLVVSAPGVLAVQALDATGNAITNAADTVSDKAKEWILPAVILGGAILYLSSR